MRIIVRKKDTKKIVAYVKKLEDAQLLVKLNGRCEVCIRLDDEQKEIPLNEFSDYYTAEVVLYETRWNKNTDEYICDYGNIEDNDICTLCETTSKEKAIEVAKKFLSSDEASEGYGVNVIHHIMNNDCTFREEFLCLYYEPTISVTVEHHGETQIIFYGNVEFNWQETLEFEARRWVDKKNLNPIYCCGVTKEELEKYLFYLTVEDGWTNNGEVVAEVRGDKLYRL